MKATFMVSLILFVASSTHASAYIDPVSASIVLQAVVGGFAAFLVAVRRVRERIFGMIFRRKPSETGTEGNE